MADSSLVEDAVRALEPFAKLAEVMSASRDGEILFARTTSKARAEVTVGDLRDARSAFLRLCQDNE